MASEHSVPDGWSPRSGHDDPPNGAVSDRSLVLRNYDGAETHGLTVRVLDARDAVAFDRTFTLGPLETVALRTRLERAVYLVEATLDDDATASAECLVGSGPNEVALVEVGNGIVSVSEGFV